MTDKSFLSRVFESKLSCAHMLSFYCGSNTGSPATPCPLLECSLREEGMPESTPKQVMSELLPQIVPEPNASKQIGFCAPREPSWVIVSLTSATAALQHRHITPILLMFFSTREKLPVTPKFLKSWVKGVCRTCLCTRAFFEKSFQLTARFS